MNHESGIANREKKDIAKVVEIRSYAKSAKDLEVYQRAYKVSLEVHKASLAFPREEQFALANQVRRASKSICANLAEGFAKQKYSSAEFKRFVQVAIGSSEEMQVWIDYCLDLGYIGAPVHAYWQEEYSAVTRKLYMLQSKIKR